VRLVPIYAKMSILSLCRNKPALFFGIFFPTLLYLMFGHGNGSTNTVASFVVFCNYAVQTILFLSLGMTISMQRSSEWVIYLRTLPALPYVSMLGLIIEKALSAVCALTLVVLASVCLHGVLFGLTMYLYVMLAAIMGGIPMAFLGIAIGYRVGGASSRSLFVFINLMLLFSAYPLGAHGFWYYVDLLIPARHWQQISLNYYYHQGSVLLPWLWMLGFGVVFYGLSVWSYHARKDLRRA
jgi:ABC-2 type transport system permease protein